ncbi:MAG TPA: flagellin [Terracidiphilus sp.]|nr:flagellin [Terracidiphilus sp.]
MSLGVLNNLSAVYAENNLNNSNNSLNTVLQQLSSGSKINSGADDAAGLSLVDGLQANQQALTQSQTNATEGVGMLQVADGALSQVTSLLNRAVTLATEASNGTLNSSQDTAANQEYQSILSEISNIGSTTTYNNQAVFNSNTNIYTGDSSTAGSAIDALNIRSLSSSNVGDTGGAMAYSTGDGNTFIDLSVTGHNAGLDDTLASGDGIEVTQLVNGQTLSHNVAVPAGNLTVGGLISAINSSGYGLTAQLTTGTAAGDSTAGTHTGIEITSTGSIGGGTGVGTLGTITASAGADTFNDNSDAVTITTADGKQHQIAMASNSSGGANTGTLADLETNINDANLGVTASLSGGTLTLTASNSNIQVVSSLYDNAAGHLGSVGFTGSTYFTTGIETNATGIADATSTKSVAASTAAATDTSASSAATISYSDNAGESLVSTDLSNESDAQTALTALNSAITDVAAQDGYIGAQINTLNAVSQVLSTQQENVQSAQNAVQATDYASATSNMSKYEILSQTGISALAQANSMQQEVTKLLQ